MTLWIGNGRATNNLYLFPNKSRTGYSLTITKWNDSTLNNADEVYNYRKATFFEILSHTVAERNEAYLRDFTEDINWGIHKDVLKEFLQDCLKCG